MCTHRKIQKKVWPRHNRIRKCLFAIGILLVLLFAQGVALAGTATYTIVDEKIYDAPVKTQIEQYIVVSGVPTETNLKAELLKRYRAAISRRGFQYHNSAANIYIYIYGSIEQARASLGLWIGMIQMGPLDKGEPRVSINNDRLAALSRKPEERFGLSEQKRKQVYREISAAENRATKESMARIPNFPGMNLAEIMKQAELNFELLEKYKDELIRKYGLTDDQLLKITVEGVIKGWPY